MIEAVLLDLALCRLAGVRERPTRPARLAAPLLLGVDERLGAVSRGRGREGRLRAVTKQVDVFPHHSWALGLVSSSLFTARPTSRE